MIDETKNIAEGTASADLQEEESLFSFQNIFAILVLNWQMFLLSFFICICAALLYLRYATPNYQVSAKMLIKNEDSRRRSSANQMLANMQDFGFMSNSAGIENEVEILQSRILAREAVKDLKLYVQYYSFGRLSKHLMYGSLPFRVDPDTAMVNQWDRELLDGNKSIQMVVTCKDNKYEVKGETFNKGESTSEFSQTLEKFPAVVKTDFGKLTISLTKNEPMKDGAQMLVNILPPMSVATTYSKALNVAPTSKMTSIAELTLNDQNVKRGLDYLNQLAVCYNRQANADKNEIALKTEEFINERLQKIDAELGSTEDELENYKKRNAVTELKADAAQSLAQSTQYETKLTEVNSQIQLMDYLREGLPP